MKAQEIAKNEGLLDNKKRKDRTKTKVRDDVQHFALFFHEVLQFL